MHKTLKWLIITGGALLALVVGALILVPFFVDIEQYKPQIEKQVSDATGRDFTIGGRLKLSLFPWAGIAFSDLYLGNPAGFGEKEMLSIKSFDIRVKLLPLIVRNLQIKRLVIDTPRIVLVKDRTGRGNWEGFREKAGEAQVPAASEKVEDTGSAGKGLPIKDLAVGEFAITNGALLYIDRTSGARKEVADLGMHLEDVSLDRPIHLTFSARVDNQPIGLEGTFGPLGQDAGKTPLPIQMVVKLFGQIEMSLNGRVTDAAGNPTFDLSIGVKPFSPRTLVAALGQTFPIETADPMALDKVALKMKLKGIPTALSLADGALTLDDTEAAFSGKTEAFSRPVLVLRMKMNHIDLDRYLPPDDRATTKKDAEAGIPEKVKEKTDYGPLRRLVLDANVQIEKLKVAKANMENVQAVIKAKSGLIQATVKSDMYRGVVSSHTQFNVTSEIPKTSVKLEVKDLKVNPLLRDMLSKDILEGATEARMQLSMVGTETAAVKKSLSGRGQLRFKDGALKGVDLASMARNVKSAFGLAKAGGKKPRTDFSELFIPFDISRGLVRTGGAKMASPFIRVSAEGQADLFKETLDFRINPRLVGTLKGQGDTQSRSGITVPVAVSGTFASPIFAPDLEGVAKGKIQELVKPEGLKSLLPAGKGSSGDPQDDPVKRILKGLPFGN